MKSKVGPRQKRNVPEFEPPLKGMIESIRQNFQSLSSDELNHLEILPKHYFQNEYVNYIYEINFSESSSLIEIQPFAFQPKHSSSNVYSITLPPSLQKIDSDAFADCNYLREIHFLENSSLKSIGDKAFHSTALESFTVPASTETIGSHCFPVTLQSLTFESGCPNLTRIGQIGNCKIETIELPINTKILKGSTFTQCKNLKTMIFDKFTKEKSNSDESETQENHDENSVDDDFDIDISDKEAIFPPSLENLEFSITKINRFSFEHTPNLTNIKVDKPNTKYVKIDNCVYSKDMKILIVGERTIKQVTIRPECETINDYSLNIPSLDFVKFPVNDKSKLRKIESYAFFNTKIQQAVLPNSVEHVGNGAFAGCTQMEKLVLSSNLRTIGNSAFMDISISEITVPSSVTRIEYCGFYKIPTLRIIKFADKSQLEIIGSYSFASAGISSIKIPASVRTIDEHAFSKCLDLTSLQFIDNSQLETIGSCAFSATKISTVTIPKSVKTISDSAFYHCNNLTAIQFEEGSGLQTIAAECFQKTQISTVKLPNSIESFDFSSSALSKLDFLQAPNIYSLPTACLEFTLLTEVVIPKNITIIDPNAFHSCANLVTVKFDPLSQLQQIGLKAFCNCSQLTTMNLPETVRFFGSFCFENCEKYSPVLNLNTNQTIEFATKSFYNSGIRGLNIKSKEVTFDGSCFSSTKQLTKIELQVQEAFVDRSCFRNSNIRSFICNDDISSLILTSQSFIDSAIENFPIPQCLKKIPWRCFENCHNLQITDHQGKVIHAAFHQSEEDGDEIKRLPYNEQDFKFKTKLFRYIDGNFFYHQFELYAANEMDFDLINDVLYDAKRLHVICCELRSPTINIIKEAEIINSGAFQFSRIRQISFEKESSLRTIESNVFSETQLESIELPDSVTILEEKAFYCCTNLTSVNINPTSKLISIGNHCFYKTNIDTITFPSTLRSIGDYAFSNCVKLSEVYNNSNKLDIGYSAFSKSSIEHFLFPAEGVFGIDSFYSCYKLLQIEFLNDPVDVLFDELSFSCSNVESLAISTGKVVINRIAFFGCQSLKKVTITTDNAQVDPTAFDLSQLKQLTIPNWETFPDASLVSLDYFKSRTYLYSKRCHIQNQQINKFDLFDTPYLFEKENPRNKKKKAPPKNEFHIVKRNESVEVPKEALSIDCKIATHIKQFSFEKGSKFTSFCPRLFEFSNLLKISIPKTVQIIPPYLFNNCYYLKHVTFEKKSKLRQIGEYAFAKTAIKEIELPQNLKIIERYAFYNCKRLRNIQFNGQVIGDYAFADSGLFQFEASNDLKEIGQYAFYNCAEMTTFVINADESQIESMGPYAFSQTGLKEFPIPANVNIIEEGLLSSCLQLKRTTFSAKSKARVIKKYAFSNNPLLQIVRAPKTIQELSGKAFINTPSLITLFNESNALFEVTKDLTVYGKDRSLVFVPRHVTSVLVLPKCPVIHSGAFCGPKLKSVQFLDESLLMIERCAFAHATALKTISLPKSLQVIGSDAFVGCQGLETVTFDSKCQVLNIPKFCFAFSGLKKIDLPYAIRHIQHSAFYFCTDLKQINLADTNLQHIDIKAFANTAITKITFPQSLKSIYSLCFDGNKSLTTIDLKEVKSIQCTDRQYPLKYIHEIKNRKHSLQKQLIEEFQNAAHINDKEKRLCIQITKKTTQEIKPAFNLTSKIDPKIIKPKAMKKKGKTTVPQKNSPEVHEPSGPPANQSPKAHKVSPITVISSPRPDHEIRPLSKFAKINELCFYGSSVSTILLNQSSYNWWKFFSYCRNLKNITINDQIQLKVSCKNSFDKPNNEASFYDSDIFNLCGMKYDDLATMPAVSYNSDIVAFHFNQPIQEISPSCFYYCSNLIKITFDSKIDLKVIPEKCFSFTPIQQIEIPNSVQIISKEAFAHCTELETVKISPASSLTWIGTAAFYECSNLKTIYIPASVTELEYFSFANSGLTEIRFDNEDSQLKFIALCSFMNTPLAELVLPDNLKKLDEKAFGYCTQLKTVILGSNLEEIGVDAFFNCSKLTTIDIPDSVQIIRKRAFNNCTNLKYLNTTENTKLVEIQQGALRNTQVESLLLNCEATEIFDPCNVPKLQSITFAGGPPKHFILGTNGVIYRKSSWLGIVSPKDESSQSDKLDSWEDLLSIQYYTDSLHAKNEETRDLLKLQFVPKNSTNITLRFNCMDYSKHVFTDMKKPISITYENGLITILDKMNFNGLAQDLHFNANLLVLQPQLCFNNTKLETVDFGNSSIKLIPKQAFMNCTSLKSIIIPKECKSILQSAFENCTSLSSVTFNDELSEILQFAFKNCKSLPQLKLPPELTHIHKQAFYGCSKLKEIEGNENLIEIGPMAFMNCSKLTKVTLHCPQIGAQTFMNCTSLTTFNHVGEKLTGFPYRIFYNCSKLATITAKLTFDNQPIIGIEAFMNCTKLTSVDIKVNETKFNEWTIDYFVQLNEQQSFEWYRHQYYLSIFRRAFMNCTSLTTVKIDFKHLRFILDEAFANCRCLNSIVINSRYWGSEIKSRRDLKFNLNLSFYKETTFKDTPKELTIQNGSEKLQVHSLPKTDDQGKSHRHPNKLTTNLFE